MFARFMQALFNGTGLITGDATAGFQDAADPTSKNYIGAAAIPATIAASVAALSGSALTLNQSIGSGVNKLIINLTKVPIVVTDALAYSSIQIIDFPQCQFQVLGCSASLQWAVATDRTTTINDSASLTWALGTVAASNITLSSTMVDVLPKTTKTLTAATTAFNTASTGVLAAASAQFNGTGTAKDLFLNVGFETNTDIDADGTLWATGTVTLIWLNAGDL